VIESEYELVSVSDGDGQMSVIVTPVKIISVLVVLVSYDVDGHYVTHGVTQVATDGDTYGHSMDAGSNGLAFTMM